MTSTPDIQEQDKNAQMAEALIAHLGNAAAAAAFAERQRLVAEDGALATWTAISAYLEQIRVRR